MNWDFLRDIWNDASKGMHSITRVLIVMWCTLVVALCIIARASAWSNDAAGVVVLALSAGALIVVGVELILSEKDEPGYGHNGRRRSATGPSVRLMWTHGVQSCGIYKAIRDGVDLDLKEGGSPIGLEPIPCVLHGIDDFGVTSALDLIRTWHQRLKNDEDDSQLVPCLLIFRKSPAIAICRGSEVPSLADLNGARVTFPSYSDSVHLEFRILLAGIDRVAHGQQIECKVQYAESIEDIEHPLRALESEDTDYRVGYAFNEGLRAKITPTHSSIYLHELFGQRELYADVMFTSLSHFNRKPKECREVALAIRNGYLACAGRPQAVSDVGHKWFPDEAKALDRIQSSRAATFDPWKYLSESVAYCADLSEMADNRSCLVGKDDTWRKIEALVSTQSSYVDFLSNHGLFSKLLVTVPPVAQ